MHVLSKPYHDDIFNLATHDASYTWINEVFMGELMTTSCQKVYRREIMYLIVSDCDSFHSRTVLKNKLLLKVIPFMSPGLIGSQSESSSCAESFHSVHEEYFTFSVLILLKIGLGPRGQQLVTIQ